MKLYALQGNWPLLWVTSLEGFEQMFDGIWCTFTHTHIETIAQSSFWFVNSGFNNLQTKVTVSISLLKC